MADISLDSAAVTVDGPDGPVTILEPTTLVLREQRIAVIGANGSGKSTLARLLNGLVRPSNGSVSVDGLDTASDGAAVRRRVGFVFTDPEAQLVMPTVAEDVALSLRRSTSSAGQRRARALDVLDRYGLRELADVSVHALSGGQKQLLALAGVLATDPAVLVADEPTTLLDLRNTQRIAELLFSLAQQLILVTHDLALAERCERGIVVDAARVAFDGAAGDAVKHYRRLVSEA
ncbi:energy-coupling factor ABC transporter ATP-binding protein [Solicola gregarius]|uniref:Energy-coupling factor ABC transporter ATP-binding protein n=1 Tax=Solicola gregarius TaxID=2908642 RepID=A0AA46YMH6_9ACTN|nr:ABC transporter ATP-binding protein [Solicola gregarius]UYM07782.1 energy-coupling factor ABC transporter ATP-binding protein [Solicola gregarius]